MVWLMVALATVGATALSATGSGRTPPSVGSLRGSGGIDRGTPTRLASQDRPLLKTTAAPIALIPSG